MANECSCRFFYRHKYLMIETWRKFHRNWVKNDQNRKQNPRTLKAVGRIFRLEKLCIRSNYRNAFVFFTENFLNKNNDNSGLKVNWIELSLKLMNRLVSWKSQRGWMFVYPRTFFVFTSMKIPSLFESQTYATSVASETFIQFQLAHPQLV